MIHSAEIYSFKGVSKCKIDDLARFNLLIGKNNTCKSTVLEAIYFTMKEFTGSHLVNALKRRTNAPFSAEELWYNYKLNKDVNIRLRFQNVDLSMDLKFDEIHKMVSCGLTVADEARKKGASAVVSQYAGDFNNVRTIRYGIEMLGELDPVTRASISNYAANCLFLDSMRMNDVRSAEEILGEIKIKGKASEFGEYLQGIYGIGQNWEFLPSPYTSEYRATAIIDGIPFFLAGFGDGLRYAMQIIGRALMLNGSGLFIEEIESHQHPGSLKKIIPYLVDIAKKNDLQVFVTTHNPSIVWGYFEKEFPTDDERDKLFRPYHVKRHLADGIVECKLLTKENYDESWGEMREDVYSE